ncbi:chorismate mutase [Xenorhabdus bovienii]|uniref:chorismate mutase n=1 Tax=Xenorhabdus bovienii TaxID=40576 RepID=UPI0023B35002|nr:chorismate mutase [Xenorhabdus bovienii]MDE9544602.1 chorismate mutase [Xenorhabdus bovienii]
MKKKKNPESKNIVMRAIRGAIQVPEDTSNDIKRSTLLIMREIITKNELQHLDLVSCFFTVTPDLTSELPPLIIYEAGWKNLPTLCALEVKTPMMIPRMIRVLIHVQWYHENRELSHIYLPEALSSRPILS